MKNEHEKLINNLKYVYICKLIDLVAFINDFTFRETEKTSTR